MRNKDNTTQKYAKDICECGRPKYKVSKRCSGCRGSNPIRISNDGTFAICRISRNKSTLISVEDIDLYKTLPWAPKKSKRNCYVSCGSTKDHLHRLIMGINDEREVDHINRNGLDNRRSNLRIVTHSQNMKNTGKRSTNTSGYKGIYLRKGIWVAYSSVNGKTVFIATGKDKMKVVRAYDKFVSEVHGEYARKNLK